MPATAQPVVRTPIAMQQFARALLVAWRQVEGSPPTKVAAGIVWAQYALETGAGGYCWNHNLFNHKCTAAMVNAGTPFMMLANTWEIISGKKVVFQPPHPATWFRAYASFAESMAHHLGVLKAGRYASAWPAITAGDPDAYCARLRERGYYTAPLADYQRLMRAKLRAWNVSDAFDEALAEVTVATEAETLPALPEESPDTEPFVKVPAKLEFPPKVYDLDDPGERKP